MIADIFVTNEDPISNIANDVPVPLFEDFCVEAGVTIDLDFQVSTSGDKTKRIIEVVKDGVAVARSFQSADAHDTQTVQYKATLEEDATFNIVIGFIYAEADTAPESIGDIQKQLRIKLYESPVAVTNTLPECEAPAEY